MSEQAPTVLCMRGEEHDGIRPASGGVSPVARGGEPAHPWAQLLSRVEADLDALGGVGLSGLSDAEVAESLDAADRLVARLTERRWALLAEADRRDLATELPGSGAGTSTAAWWAARSRTPVAVARREVRWAGLVERRPELLAALNGGLVHPDQAVVIAEAVAGLPAQVGPELRAQAEAHLLSQAEQWDAARLRVLARHLEEVVDPEGAEERIGRRLAADERRAARTTELRMWDDDQGRTHGRFTLPALQGTMLRLALESLLNPAVPGSPQETSVPARPDDVVPGQLVPGGRRWRSELLGEALGQLIERFPVERLPRTGGVAAQVVVTIEHDVLSVSYSRGLGGRVLGSDVDLSVGQARRLACAAGVLPAVLGTGSTVLDLGRRRRLHTRAQRLAKAIEQGGTCAIGTCDRPSTWADAHHPHAWSDGGRTDVTNLVLLCPRHHTLAHSGRHVLVRGPDGTHDLVRTGERGP